MNAILVVVVGAVLAGLFTFGGVVYGSRREHDQWLRNTRISAYREFIAYMYELSIELAVQARTPSEPTGSTFEYVTAHMGKFSRMYVVLGAVEIAGPRNVAKSAIEWTHLLVKTLNSSSGEPEPTAAELDLAGNAFIDLCTSTLKSMG